MINTPNRLRAARIAAGLSQDRLAEITRYSRNTIISIEKFTGRVPDIRLPVISEYSRATGVSEIYLLHGSDRFQDVRLRLEELQGVISHSILRTMDIIETESERPLSFPRQPTDNNQK